MDLESIDHLCINPILSIGWSVSLSNCKQIITSLSLLVGTTVLVFTVGINIKHANTKDNCKYNENT